MNLSTRLRTTARILIATAALAATAVVLPAASPANATGGLRNCVDLTGRAVDQVGCWEHVWADGEEVRMTFSNTGFRGETPRDLSPFYVLAPQGGVAQGALPFGHDHVIDRSPAHNGGSYGVRLATFFVLCSGEGIATGGCVPTMSHIEGLGDLPLAKSANGQPLTTTDRIERAAAAGLLAVIPVGVVIVGTVTGND
jgi:hypothetical protein